MKVLMSHSFYYLRGGAERYLFELSSLLEKHGDEVIPFAMQHEKNYPTPYSDYFVSHIDYPSMLKQKTGLVTKARMVERLLYSQEQKQNISRLIQDTKPDILHVQGIGHEMSASILDAAREFHLPVVQTVHDYGPLCPNTSFISHGAICERCKTRRYYQAVLHRCKRDSLPASVLAAMEKYTHAFLNIYGKINVFIAPSKFLERKLIEYGIRSKIVQIPNFVDIDRFQPNYVASDYYVYIGRLEKLKGLLTLVKAAQQVPSAKLYIAGDGELKEELQQYISQNCLDHIVLLGHLASDELSKLVAGAAFTVMPSEYYENYPMSIIESFACGKPVIATNHGAMPDLVKEGQNGMLFTAQDSNQLAQKIQYLLSHPEETMTMGKNGREQVETFNDPETHYQRIQETYELAKEIHSRTA
jgi:glycosyltransferase involved in cell wall biosynthesis